MKIKILGICVVIKDIIREIGLTMYSFARILLEANCRGFKIVVRRKELENRKSVLLVNGPSLTKDLESHPWIMMEKNIWCVNSMATSELYDKLKPRYYVMSDPGWWMKNIPKMVEKQREETIEQILTKTKWGMKIFLPFEARKSSVWDNVKKKPDIEIRYFNQNSIVGFRQFRNWCYCHGIGTPICGNVLIPMLINAMNVGYREIYIAGADHSMHKEIYVDRNNCLNRRDCHFYGKEEERQIYQYGYKYGMCNDKKRLRIASYFAQMSNLFMSHQHVREYADYCGARIINVTEETFIDSYERKR